MPKKYLVESTYDFSDIVKTVESPKMLASLDVESLFSNVPEANTIDIIIENDYNYPTVSPPGFPKLIMKKLVKICITETPFKTPSGELYQQREGVSMGAPLDPTFANYYMCNLENSIFNSLPNTKPRLYYEVMYL